MSRFHFEHEMPISSLTEEDLIDDSVGIIPMVGLKTPQSIRSRFISRLERLLNMEVKIEESTAQRSIAITVTRVAKVGRQTLADLDSIRSILKAMTIGLSLVAKDITRELACDRLKVELFSFTYENNREIIEKMRLLFEENREIYHDFVVRMFGVDDFDPGDSMTDSELGDQIISLHQQVIACKNSMRDTHALIEFASQLTRIITHLQDRLRGLLGRAKFAGELYQLICGLGFPEHVYSTLIRAASSSRNFENIIFYFSPETPSRRVAFKSPTTSPMYTPGKVVPYQKAKLLPTATPSRPRQQNGPKPPYHHANTSPPPTRIVNDSVLQVSSPLQEKSKRLEHFESAGISGPINNEDSLAPARPYLSPSDRALSILQLKPQSKQITAHLIATVLRSAILPIASEAWFYFWFVAVKNEDEERYLAGFYAKILKEAQNSEKVFEELMKALEDKTLGCLFDVQGYEHFRKAFPHLELFFNTPPNRSLTVWRLKQFVLSDQSVESPACLQRDYGFKFCRTREEVDRMKMLYTIMLQKVGPIVIHGHCIVNRLYEEGIIKTGIPMNAKDARLMKNDYPSSFLGYDNDLGLVAYRGPFFKRTLKI